MASKYSISTIFKALDEYSNPVKKMDSITKQFAHTLKTDFARAQRSVDRFTTNFSNSMKTGLMIGAGIALAGLGMAIKEGIKLASDLTEVQNVVDTTFRDSAGAMNDWSKTALNAFGLSELQAKKFSGVLGAMLKSSGISGDMLVKMSQDMTGLAGDFASFYNLEHQEAFDKIKAGISGETEPLKSLGINMSVANLEQFALSKGIRKRWKDMTQGEQVMLRYNFLMKASTDAQGDFAKTLDTSLANQERLLKTKFNQILADSMSKLLPLLIDGAKWLNKLLDNIDKDKLAESIKQGAIWLMKFGKALYTVFKFVKPFLPILLGAVIAWKAYQFSLIIAAAAQWAMNVALTANPIGLIIVGIGILIGLIIVIVIHWKTIVKWLKIGWEWLVKTWDAFKGLMIIFGPIGFWIAFLIELVRGLIEHWGYITEAFQSEGIISGILAIGKVILSALLAPIENLFLLLGKIPGVGKMFKEWGLNIGNFRTGMFQSNAPITQGDRMSYSKQETVSKGELTINDKTGSAEMTKKPKTNNYNIRMRRSGAF